MMQVSLTEVKKVRISSLLSHCLCEANLLPYGIETTYL
jgi:hypothetical protein